MTVAGLALGVGAVLLWLTVARLYAPFVLAIAGAAVVVGVAGGVSARRTGASGVWLARVGVALGVVAGVATLIAITTGR